MKTECLGDKTQVSLAQTPLSKAVPAATTWQAPICYKRSRNGRVEPAACEVLSESSRTLTLDGCSSWLFANVDSRGYYRTAYSPKDLDALEAAVRRKELTDVEETSLLEDEWTVVGLQQDSIARFLSLAEAITDSGASPVIDTIAGHLNDISDHLIDAEQRPATGGAGREAEPRRADVAAAASGSEAALAGVSKREGDRAAEAPDAAGRRADVQRD